MPLAATEPGHIVLRGLVIDQHFDAGGAGVQGFLGAQHRLRTGKPGAIKNDRVHNFSPPGIEAAHSGTH